MRLDHAAAIAESYGLRPRRRLIRTRAGGIGREVAEVARDHRAELVVVGSPVTSRRGFRRPFPQEILQILRDAPCRVMVATGPYAGRSRVRAWPDAAGRQHELERVLGANALFATAYGNVGSSIYYALGVTAFFALGLTPVVFLVAGLFFAATAATYAEGTVRYPEAGGSSSFARHAFNEVVSFGAAWAQMLNYVITIAISAFFVPHYLSIFWGPLRENPWDIIGGAVVIVVLVALNIVGIQESASINVVLAAVDFATQVLLVLLGFFLVFSPHTLHANIHFGAAPTWSHFLLAIPVGMIAYTGIETVSNLSEEARDPVRSIPRSITMVAIAVFAIYFTLPMIALSAMPVHLVGGHYQTMLGLGPEKGGFANDPVLGLVEHLGIAGTLLSVIKIYVGPARRDDPLHRDERRRDRRLADHVRDGRIPAAPGRLPAVASALQDALAVADRVRGDRLDPRAAAREDELPRHDVLVRRDALVHGRARGGDPAAAAAAPRRARVQGTPELHVARRRLAAVRNRRRRRNDAVLARRRHPVSEHALRRAWLARVRLRGYIVYRRRILHVPLAQTVRAPVEIGPAQALEYRSILVPIAPGHLSEEAMDVACRLAAERRASIVAVTVIEVPLELPLDAVLPDAGRGGEHAPRRGARDRRVVRREGDRAASSAPGMRARRSSRRPRAAARRSSSWVLRAMRFAGGRRAIFSDTVDFVLKHAPCRVMVAAGRAAA